MSVLSVVPATESQIQQATALAQQYGWPLLGVGAPCPTPLLLWVGRDGYALKSGDQKRQNPITAKLTAGAIPPSGPESWVRGQPLARAVGIKGSNLPSVLDATAGLGGDGWLMARMGCEVILAERVALMALLLSDGLQQAKRDPERHDVAQRLTLHTNDARQVMQTLPDPVEVIYLDPMFPHEGKGSLPRKAMVALRQLAGDDQDLPELFDQAMATAQRRVVLKRPLKAPLLTQAKPNFQLKGRSTRFDVYTTG
ncbi:class I SAM-dependent methyltransferase [Magnetococcus sp. PR-3]|uniref:class I SAM-dependent methyltransferase n=1 Tax=Magnetococcus sp. PR-3 TaxID=3120355 RepID=UPI002FCE1E5F